MFTKTKAVLFALAFAPATVLAIDEPHEMANTADMWSEYSPTEMSVDVVNREIESAPTAAGGQRLHTDLMDIYGVSADSTER